MPLEKGDGAGVDGVGSKGAVVPAGDAPGEGAAE